MGEQKSTDAKQTALETIKEHGLPKGEVTRLLKEQGIEDAVIEKLNTRLVPYTYTD